MGHAVGIQIAELCLVDVSLYSLYCGYMMQPSLGQRPANALDYDFHQPVQQHLEYP